MPPSAERCRPSADTCHHAADGCRPPVSRYRFLSSISSSGTNLLSAGGRRSPLRCRLSTDACRHPPKNCVPPGSMKVPSLISDILPRASSRLLGAAPLTRYVSRFSADRCFVLADRCCPSASRLCPSANRCPLLVAYRGERASEPCLLFCLATIVPPTLANEKRQRQNRKATRILRHPFTLCLISATHHLKDIAQ